MTVDIEINGKLGVFKLEGDLSAALEEPMLKAYADVDTHRPTKLLLRFVPECTINSAGIAVLISVISQARREGKHVGVAGLSPHYRKIFDLIGLTEYVEMLTDEEAVKTFMEET
jgi:anti-anti-sigma factor